ncbi:hypothetical protein COOONC_05369 [Cooperia oncophora]
MDQVYRYELTKAVKRLQQVMDSIDKSLLEDAQFDGDQESVSNQIRGRSKAITIAHATLSREIDLALQTWRSAIEYPVSKERGRAPCSRMRLPDYWSTSGGEAAEGRARDLITKLDVVMRLLQQDDVNSLSTTVPSGERKTTKHTTSNLRRSISLKPIVEFLKSALRDDALSVVTGYEITEANYEMAINTVREAYFPP